MPVEMRSQPRITPCQGAHGTAMTVGGGLVHGVRKTGELSSWQKEQLEEMSWLTLASRLVPIIALDSAPDGRISPPNWAATAEPSSRSSPAIAN